MQYDLVSRCMGTGTVCANHSDCDSGQFCEPTCTGTDSEACEVVPRTDPRRCSNDMHIVCTSDTDCPSTDTCERFFGPPIAVFFPAPFCVAIHLPETSSGSINLETGATNLPLRIQARAWIGAFPLACPVCESASGELEIGDVGICSAGARDGFPCTVHGKSAEATTSWDCPPSRSDNVSADGLPVPLELTTGSLEKTAELSCGGSLEATVPDPDSGRLGLCTDTREVCASNADCMRCAEDLTQACTSNDDCGDACLGAPDQPISCGTYCLCGTCSQDHTIPCSSHAECGDGNRCETSRPNRNPTVPNLCGGSVCGSVEPRRCCSDAEDPLCFGEKAPQTVCSLNTEFECGGEATCTEFGYGSCDTIVQEFGCFENRITVAGELASTGGIDPVLVGLGCAGASSVNSASSVLDNVAQTPAPATANFPSLFTPCRCGNGAVECDESCDDGPAGSATCDTDCTTIP